LLLSKVVSNSPAQGAFSTKQAAGIDGAIDDGDPQTGTIRSYDGSDQTANDCIDSNGEYNLGNTESYACIIRVYNAL